MDRRNFIGSAALIPAAALVADAQQSAPAPAPPPGGKVSPQGATAPPPPRTAPTQVAKGVKITVLKRTVDKEMEKYRGRAGETPVCNAVKDGQEFMAKWPWQKPEGMCGWAWDDLRKSIYIVANGELDQMVGCCTDGYRPVFFLLQRVV